MSRVLLQADAYFYFNPVTGSDTTGTGTNTNPFKTPVAIYDLARATLDTGIYRVHAVSQAACPSIDWIFRGPLVSSVGVSSYAPFAMGPFVVEGASGQGFVISDNGAGVTFNNSNLQIASSVQANLFVVTTGGGYFAITGNSTFTTAPGGDELFHTASGFMILGGNVTVVNGGSILGLGNAEDNTVIIASGHWTFTGGNPFSQFCFQADLGGGIDTAAATQTGYSGPPSRVAGGGGWLNLGGGFP